MVKNTMLYRKEIKPINKDMKKLFHKITLLSSLILLSSCYIFKDFREDYQRPKVRFVNLQGEVKPVELKTPPQNIEALNKQGNLTYNKLHYQPPATQQEKISSENKYSRVSQNDLEKTLALPTSQQPKAIENDKKTNAFENQEVLKEVEYDLAKEEPKIQEKTEEKPQKTIITKKKTYNKAPIVNRTIKKGYYAQAGSFRTNRHALEHISKIKKLTPKSARYNIQKAIVRGKNYHRVLIGPYKYRKNANLMISKLKNKKQNAILIKVK